MTTTMTAATGSFRLSLRFRHTDLDAQKLIGNVAIAGMFEEARTQYSINRRLKPAFDPYRRVLAAVTITFGKDLKYPGAIDFEIGVLEIVSHGWTLQITATQESKFVARCETTFMLQSDGGPIVLPDGLIKILQGDLICPQECD